MSYQERAQPGARGQQQMRTTAVEEHPWATGFAVFAGFIMIMAGTFEAFAGLAAILQDDLFIVTRNYAYDLDVTTWGWVHLFVGIVVALAGIYVFSGQLWARIIGILAALAAAVVNFMYIPYYPIWSVLIISLCVVVIWALAVYKGPEEMISGQ
jgi:hypothetical protein